MSLLLASTVSMALPARVGAWSRPETPRVVAPADVFAYMDGAGELYLAYNLVRLEVYEYTAEQEDSILLELYHLDSSDDGYGLLSGDWGGEPLALDAAWPALPPRALYGAGLLRVWSGDLYVRVLATSETEASRAAVVDLGRAVVAGRPSPPPPDLVASLPERVAGSFALRRDSVAFLRSHLVLNSLYFLGTANLLGLSSSSEAVLASYAGPAGGEGGEHARLRLLVVRYPEEDEARSALARFREAYLGRSGEAAAVRVEDGWTGQRLDGRRLICVFQAQDERTVKAVLDEV